MSEFELIAEVRPQMGTGAVRRLRRAGRLPAVLYGAGKEVVPLALSEKDVRKQLENEAFFSHILSIKIGAQTEQVVLKELQRHPATARVIHMDLQRVVATQLIEMHVPLHFINEQSCPGRKAGGVISKLMIEAAISCFPKDLPEFIEVDLGGLELGQAIHLSELKVPTGVELVALSQEQDQAVVSVQAPAKLEVTEVTEAEEEEAEGAAAAPEEGAE